MMIKQIRTLAWLLMFISMFGYADISLREQSLLDKGNLEYSKSNYQGAVKHYARLNYEFPNNEAYMSKLLSAFVYSGDMDSAVALASELELLNPTSVEALQAMALVKNQTGDYQGALSLYDQILLVDPDNSRIMELKQAISGIANPD